MSNVNFDRRDRQNISCTANEWTRLMVRSGGFVMVRDKGGRRPYVLTEKEWARLPLFQPDARTGGKQ